jgi:NAD(P)-dependent dehydrogenase (short-subunit alcohol dehydrogenase family)
MKLRRKVVMITGEERGLGKASAIEMSTKDSLWSFCDAIPGENGIETLLPMGLSRIEIIKGG